MEPRGRLCVTKGVGMVGFGVFGLVGMDEYRYEVRKFTLQENL